MPVVHVQLKWEMMMEWLWVLQLLFLFGIQFIYIFFFQFGFCDFFIGSGAGGRFRLFFLNGTQPNQLQAISTEAYVWEEGGGKREPKDLHKTVCLLNSRLITWINWHISNDWSKNFCYQLRVYILPMCQWYVELHDRIICDDDKCPIRGLYLKD